MIKHRKYDCVCYDCTKNKNKTCKYYLDPEDIESKVVERCILEDVEFCPKFRPGNTVKWKYEKAV